MDQEEKLKMVYDQINTSVRYFLDWRHKLLGGYIVIISALYYFILTWVSQPEHFTVFIYVLACSIGLLLSLAFCFLSHRNNETLWVYQNNGYMYEKRLEVIDTTSEKPVYGLFGAIIDEEIKTRIDIEKKPKLELKKVKDLFRIKTHLGVINWIYLLVFVSFIVLLFQTCSLNSKIKKVQAQVIKENSVYNK